MDVLATVGLVIVLGGTLRAEAKKTIPPVNPYNLMQHRTVDQKKREHPWARPAWTGTGWDKRAVTVTQTTH